jgi:tetratricopeptide (TPR) repeat protein
MRNLLLVFALVLPTVALAREPAPQATTSTPISTDTLLRSLAAAKSPQEAHSLEGQLDSAWNHSGSPTADLLLQRAQRAHDDGDIDTALDLLKRLTKVAPNFAQGWNERAAVSAEKEDYEDTIQSLHHALALEPRHYGALVGLGAVLEEFGDKPHALEAYKKALAIDPYIDGIADRVRELSRDLGGQNI